MSAERKEVVAHEQTVPQDTAAIVSVIERAALNPAVDIDKMERLLLMQERIIERNAKAAFTAALAEMQPKLPVIDERGEIKHDANKPPQSTYARYEDINDAIRPLLAQHGFALSFRIKRSDNLVSITGILSHREGHSDETTLDLPVDTSGSKNAVQAVGSSISYGKRYAAIALLNITSRAPQDRDDDGTAAGRRGQSPAAEAAVTAINNCQDIAALKAWKAANAAGLNALKPAEANEIIRLVNSRLAKLRGDAQ